MSGEKITLIQKEYDVIYHDERFYSLSEDGFDNTIVYAHKKNVIVFEKITPTLNHTYR